MCSVSYDEKLFPAIFKSSVVLRRRPVFPYFFLQEVIFVCVREEPVVFLHKDNDFVPYTPRRKENLHENLHDLEKEERVESLELTIRKEVRDKLMRNPWFFFVICNSTKTLLSSTLHSSMTSPSSTKTSSTSTMTSSSLKTSRRRYLSRARRTSMWLKRSTRGRCSLCRPTGCLHCSFIMPELLKSHAQVYTKQRVAACCWTCREGYK